MGKVGKDLVLFWKVIEQDLDVKVTRDSRATFSVEVTTSVDLRGRVTHLQSPLINLAAAGFQGGKARRGQFFLFSAVAAAERKAGNSRTGQKQLSKVVTNTWKNATKSSVSMGNLIIFLRLQRNMC